MVIAAIASTNMRSITRWKFGLRFDLYDTAFELAYHYSRSPRCESKEKSFPDPIDTFCTTRQPWALLRHQEPGA